MTIAVEVEEQRDVLPSAVRRRPAAFLDRYRLWILLLITLAGGVARFATLDRPPLWGDEAFTYYRVSGDFRQLIDILQFDGFPPLHYEAYWELRQSHKLTPKVMRLIPATAGTLMVPVMYFLAAQVLRRRRVALLVALFTACSAYMMAYSHDAKMYMACWMFLALHVGCLLWWLRVGRSAVGRVAWLAWVAAGLAAVGFHHSANLLLPVELVIVLTFPRSPEGPSLGRRLLPFFLGALVISAGPAGYFLGFNRITEKVDQQGFAMGSGTNWVDPYNYGRGPADLALFTATAHLYSWEWPLKPDALVIDHDVLHGLMAAGAALLLLLAIGAIPWTKREPREPSGSAAGPSAVTNTWWRPALWLSLWIIPLGYGWYCASTRKFSSPTGALLAFGSLFDGHWIALLLGIAALALIAHVWPALPRYLAATIPIIALLSLGAILLHAHIDKPWLGREWHEQYWPVLTEWWSWLTAPRFLLMLLIALPVIAWHNSAERPVDRAIRLAQLLGVAAAVFAACWLAYHFFTWRVDALARRMVEERKITPDDARAAVWANWLSVWMPRYLGIAWPAVAIAACALLARLPTRPLRYAAVILLLGLNVAQATARLIVGTEPPSGLVAADIAASQDRAGHPADARTYLFDFATPVIPSPGSLSFVNWQSRYYLSQVSDAHIAPRDFLMSPGSIPSLMKLWHLKLWNDQRPAAIAADVNAAPQLRRLIVWERLNTPDDGRHPSGDLARRLGPAWRLASDRTYLGRDHWTWNNLWALHRLEYVRTNPPTTVP